MPTDHEQAFGAQILKKCFHAKISETFHPLPAGTHCAVRLCESMHSSTDCWRAHSFVARRDESHGLGKMSRGE